MKIRANIYLAAVCLALFAGFAAAGENDIIGWRTDGTGLFPDADPPLTWGRRSESVSGLRAQAGKPKAGDTGVPIADGVIRDWLVLGPVLLPEDFKAAKNEVIPGEADLQARENEGYKDLKWTKVIIDNSCVDFKALYGPDNLDKGDPQQAAYAQAWIKSDSEQTIIMNFVTAGKHARVWLNGKLISPKKPVTLNKGWNCFASRVISNPCDQSKAWSASNSWYLRLVFFGAADSTYTTKNIAWSTPMPGQGHGGPIIVGDRIFVTADQSNLICANKRDGKILWMRSNTGYDALSAEEKQNAEFKEAGDLNRQLQEMNQKFVNDSDITDKFIWDKMKLEKKIHMKMKQSTFTRSEVGTAANTPVSDGRHVYALFGNCVAACYDLSGNRKWIGYYPRDHYEHGHHSSPVLVDGKMIICLTESMLALDQDTGKLLWETSLKKDEKQGLSRAKFSGTPIALSQNGKHFIFTPAGQVVRVSDGKTVYYDNKPKVSSITSPVRSEGWIYLQHKEVRAVKFPDLTSESIKPETVQIAKINPRPFPMFYHGGHMASPLVHKGLMYCLSIDGLLSVIDLSEKKIVYQKMLDLDPQVGHSGNAIRAGIASSPALGGKYIYLFGNQGACLAIEPGRIYKQVAKNRIECIISPNGWSKRQEVNISCPVFEGNRIYIRAEGNLYCLQTDQ